MNKISITELKLFKTTELQASLPFEVTSDGIVIATVSSGLEKVVEIKETKDTDRATKCPNCKFVYNVTPPDNLPNFFSIQHP